MKKILLITSLFPNPIEENRGIFVANIVRELRKSHKVTVISLIPYFPKLDIFKRFHRWHNYSRVPKDYTFEGEKVLCLKYFAIPKIVTLHSFFLFIAMLPTVIRLHKKERFDLINTHWLFPDGVASFWISRILKIPIVLTAHGSDINWYLNTPARKGQIIRALRGAQKITVVSEQQKETLKKYSIDGQRVTIIHNGFGESFSIVDKMMCRKELNLDINKKIIGFIGRLVEIKGLRYLLEAVKELVALRKDDFKLIVVGDGQFRKKYEIETEKLNLNDKVIFSGEKRHSELGKWYCASDVVCLPSESEGCPTVLIEALASGRPVVASNVGEIPKLINDSNGILVAPKEVKQLSFALNRALENSWDESNIRESVKHLTWETSAKEYIRVYREALAQ